MSFYLVEKTPGDAKQAYGPFATPAKAVEFLQFVREGEYELTTAVRRIVTKITKTVDVTADEVIP